MIRKLAAAAVVLAASASLVSLPASPAAANPRVEAQVEGAWGYLANIEWVSWTYVAVNFYLRDTSPDGEHAEARAQTLDDGGNLHSFPWHSAVGYGTAYDDPNAYVRDTRGVQAIRIQVCRKGDDLPDVCDWSSWAWNPYQ